MTVNFWKYCDLALSSCNSLDFKNALSLCDKAGQTLVESEPFQEGRKNYLETLVKLIHDRKSYSSDARIIQRPISNEANSEVVNAKYTKPYIDPLCVSGILDELQLVKTEEKEDFGIIVFGFTRTKLLETTLESLRKQHALKYTEVWIDGDQGNPELRKKIEKTVDMVSSYPVKHIHTQRGNYGFRKMILLALKSMVSRYKEFVVLEDDCFPSRNMVTEFKSALSKTREKSDVLTVYGHHFGLEKKGEPFGRFQGWGWGTNSAKFIPVLRQLIDCYSMPEKDYLQFVKTSFTADIQRKIEITPPRLPSHTLANFFAWDETLCLLSALNGQTHMPTDERVIFNCGIGEDSAHFRDQDIYRKPPFNMIPPSTAWDYF
ncbi:glycosyltransferase [Thalassotalea euphylliae]|uniref:glycosyltransferase n=1 Tax=Thalassotalea euphylliae TaxID=1655234 RepID=UPI0015F28376|nr:glycosyltransferase [Thalassotalea euphylliae]